MKKFLPILYMSLCYTFVEGVNQVFTLFPYTGAIRSLIQMPLSEAATFLRISPAYLGLLELGERTPDPSVVSPDGIRAYLRALRYRAGEEETYQVIRGFLGRFLDSPATEEDMLAQDVFLVDCLRQMDSVFSPSSPFIQKGLYSCYMDTSTLPGRVILRLPSDPVLSVLLHGLAARCFGMAGKWGVRGEGKGSTSLLIPTPATATFIEFRASIPELQAFAGWGTFTRLAMWFLVRGFTLSDTLGCGDACAGAISEGFRFISSGSAQKCWIALDLEPPAGFSVEGEAVGALRFCADLPGLHCFCVGYSPEEDT